MSQDDMQPVNWCLLETQVTKLFKRIPDFSTLLGLFISRVDNRNDIL